MGKIQRDQSAEDEYDKDNDLQGGVYIVDIDGNRKNYP